MDIICFGDSLTYGNVGYSYIPFMDEKLKLTNKGKNGETVVGGHDRLKKVMAEPGGNSKTYILGIGTNDVLLPYLRSVSFFWKIVMGIRCNIKKCIENDKIFRKEYSKILDTLKEKEKNVIIFGMPFVNLKNFPQDKLIKRNKIISELAEEYDYPFIDFYKLQKEEIDKDVKEYAWKYGFLPRFIDGLVMTIFPNTKDKFGDFRGLTTSVDGVHLSLISAKLLAREISRKL